MFIISVVSAWTQILVHSDYNPLMSLFISLLLLSQIWLSGAPSVWLLCLLSVSPSLSTGSVSVPTVGIGACPSSAGPSVGEWGLEMDTWLQVCSWWLRSCLVLGPFCSPSWQVSAHTLLCLICVCDAACLLSHPRPPTGSSRRLSFSSSRQPGCHSSPCLFDDMCGPRTHMWEVLEL